MLNKIQDTSCFLLLHFTQDSSQLSNAWNFVFCLLCHYHRKFCVSSVLSLPQEISCFICFVTTTGNFVFHLFCHYHRKFHVSAILSLPQEISSFICFVTYTGIFMCPGVSGTHELGSVDTGKCQHETWCNGSCLHIRYPVEILNLPWIRKCCELLQCSMWCTCQCNAGTGWGWGWLGLVWELTFIYLFLHNGSFGTKPSLT